MRETLNRISDFIKLHLDKEESLSQTESKQKEEEDIAAPQICKKCHCIDYNCICDGLTSQMPSEDNKECNHFILKEYLTQSYGTCSICGKFITGL